MNEMVIVKPRAAKIAGCFVAARAAAVRLDNYPGEIPTTMAEAYAIQDAAIGVRGGTVGGWKLGRINPPADELMGANRLAGPIFEDLIMAAPTDRLASMPIIADGFAAAEAEFLLRLSRDIAPGQARSAGIRELISQAAVGIEIASSPLPTINDLGPAVTASDFGNNHGLLVGPVLDTHAADDFDAIPVSLAIDGQVVGRATTATMLDGPWGSVRFLLDLAAARGIALSAGQWISTGAVTGVHRIKPGQRVEASFGETVLSCLVARAEPKIISGLDV
jgi:2-keto-4-pentenoate hydratase